MRPYLELIRLPAVFTAPADVLMGMALASLMAPISILTMICLVVASAAIYCAGMAANDIFDAAVDARERPGRPIPSGRVPLARAWTLVLTLQAVGLGLAAVVGTPSLIAVALTIGATYLYNAAVKDSVLGPLAMGTCRYGNALIGITAVGWPTPVVVYLIPLTTVLYVCGLTFLSRHEVDGATPQQVAPPMAVMLLGVVISALWAPLGVLSTPVGAALVAIPLLWLLPALKRGYTAPGAGPVRGAVMAGIFGIAMVNGVIAAQAGAWIAAAIIIGLLVPGKMVGRWFYAT
ncbi:MAG: UbiA family prenyltransferase [Bradymonadia bacterium]